MTDKKTTVTLKDGTKITLDDPSQIAQYSNRDDLESITFGGDDEAADAGVEDAETPQMIESVQVPSKPLEAPQKPPVADLGASLPLITGAVAGAVSSAGTPVLMNLAKSFIKGKLKLKLKGSNSGGDTKPEEEADEPTDCKTHQLKASAKFASIAARLSALEGKGGGLSLGETNPLEDLEERIEKLEKSLKQVKKKK